MRNIAALVAVLGLLAGLWLATSSAQEKKAPALVKWEYKKLTQTELDKVKGLEQLGEEGWELAAVESELREPLRVQDFKFGGTVTNVRARERTFYFKKPR